MKGFTLLFTLFIMSIVLSISLGVFNLIVGEIALSGTARESRVAFFAADSGTECALYWDVKHPGLEQSAFATSTRSEITCADKNANVGGTAVSNFELTFDDNSCVKVSVEKLSGQTIITAQGQNTLCSQTSPRTVQRGLQVVY